MNGIGAAIQSNVRSRLRGHSERIESMVIKAQGILGRITPPPPSPQGTERVKADAPPIDISLNAMDSSLESMDKLLNQISDLL